MTTRSWIVHYQITQIETWQLNQPTTIQYTSLTPDFYSPLTKKKQQVLQPLQSGLYFVHYPAHHWVHSHNTSKWTEIRRCYHVIHFQPSSAVIYFLFHIQSDYHTFSAFLTVHTIQNPHHTTPNERSNTTAIFFSSTKSSCITTYYNPRPRWRICR